jgi:hypothetical protein
MGEAMVTGIKCQVDVREIIAFTEYKGNSFLL